MSFEFDYRFEMSPRVEFSRREGAVGRAAITSIRLAPKESCFFLHEVDANEMPEIEESEVAART